MLALVAGCSAAPHPILPAQEGGKVCLSTSVELKTVTCNIDCNVDHYANNPDTQICPEACVCASTVQANDLTGALPSDEFARLVAVASDRSAGANQVVRSQVTSSSFAAKAPAAVSTPKTGASSPVALPNDGEDLYGYYAKTWACKEPFLQSPACLGPPDRNIDVVFSGYGSIAAALEPHPLLTQRPHFPRVPQAHEAVGARGDQREGPCAQRVHGALVRARAQRAGDCTAQRPRVDGAIGAACVQCISLNDDAPHVHRRLELALDLRCVVLEAYHPSEELHQLAL